MKARILLNVFLSLFLFPAVAQVTRGEDIVIDKRVKDYVNAAGSTRSVTAPVHGDFIAVGATITIGHSITQDVMVAGRKKFSKRACTG